MTSRFRDIAWLTVCVTGFCVSASTVQGQQPLSSDQRMQFERGIREIEESLETLRKEEQSGTEDAAVFAKGLAWALRYDQVFSAKEVALLQSAVTRGKQRTQALATGIRPWSTRKGKLVLGYTSAVDGSVQPYGLIVPANYDPTRPTRLDVVLHGSTRPVGLSELKFIARFDEGDGPSTSAPDHPFIELHPLGRVENCYRWAGETDVFDAIEDVCRRYHIDRHRIVLRGMSMGASGTWHLGLKHPDRFVALGPYCGYVDTHRFSETPLPNFVKVGPLPATQELGLHMLDSVDYAANAGMVPVVACMGEKDIFFQAHVLMGEAMEREGLTLVNLISPGTGHTVDPVTHAEQMRRIAVHSAAGLDVRPRNIRFVTWTLKYSRCHWLQVLGLQQHYARSEISAEFRDGVIDVAEPHNITRFAIHSSQCPAVPHTVRVGATELAVPPLTTGSTGFVVAYNAGEWAIEGELEKVQLAGKRPGLQGPIDDAFTSPFLCVRGTGRPWNPAVQAYATASLQRFADEWQQYFRGELPVKDDKDVTDEDVRTKNLILFGDPGSNSYIAKVLPALPVEWTETELRFGDQAFAASDHLPALIGPNPLPGAKQRYVVLNSGHTFREAELAKLNYLLFPRWGDWAILQVPAGHEAGPLTKERVVQSGYFDERWKVPESQLPR